MSCPRPAIWDVSGPPTEQDCFQFKFDALQRSSPLWRRYRTIELDRVSGLTFFFLEGKPIGIHSHFTAHSSALATHARFSSRRQDACVWIYLPIAPGDKVTALAIIEGQNVCGLLVSLSSTSASAKLIPE